MKLTLRLRHAGKAVHEPQAWFLPGDDPQRWLAEIATWQVDASQVRLCFVPNSLSDRRLCGVLVQAPAQTVVRHGIVYGCLQERLYLPVDAQLDPPVTAAELIDLLAADRVYVFHPSAGLVSFESQEMHALTALITRPFERDRHWSLARAGVACNRRLWSVVPRDVPSAQDIIGASGDDIGSAAEQGHTPDPQPGEPSSGMAGEAGRKILGSIAGALDWLGSQIPSKMLPGFMQQAADWAGKQLEKLGVANEFLRNKELSRLMEMLHNDPDEGLKYALPLADMNAFRGQGPSGNRLLPRFLDFRLGGGGGGGDPWVIDRQRHQQLHQRYRELAQRELNLGRYRRAAYIFAHLLNDVAAAANALRQGKHWREAATLYQEKLHRPLDAASCLVEGGLLSEALQIYEEQQQFVLLGEVYQRLGEEEAARAAFRQAVEQQRARRDYLTAARLLEERLQENEEALSTLLAGWPESNQAEACLQGAWQRLNDAGRNEELLRQLHDVREQALSYSLRTSRVKLLTQFAKQAGNLQVRACAADATRIVASRELPQATAADVQRLTDALRQLAEGDQLLERDTTRYRRQQTHQNAPRYLPPIARGRIQVASRFVLSSPQPIQWRTAVRTGGVVYALGDQDGTIVIARAINQARSEIFTQQFPGVRAGEFSVFMAADGRRSQLFVHINGNKQSTAETRLVGTDIFPETKVTRPFLGNQETIFGLACARESVSALCLTPNGFVLRWCNVDGHSLHAKAIRQPAQRPHMPFPFVAQRDVYIGWGTQLVSGTKPPFEFHRQVHSLSASFAASRSRIAVGFETGGVVFWQGSANHEFTLPFGEELNQFITGFTLGGHLIAVSAQGGEVYDTRDEKVKFLGSIAAVGSRPIAVLAGSANNQFSVVTERGQVLNFEI